MYYLVARTYLQLNLRKKPRCSRKKPKNRAVQIILGQIENRVVQGSRCSRPRCSRPLCSSKFEYLSWSPEKKSSASIDHTPDRTYENTLESIKTFHISRWKPDLCQFSLLSKNIHQMTVFINYLSCLLWNAQSVSINFTTQYGAYTWGTSKLMYLFGPHTGLFLKFSFGNYF